MSVEIVPLRPEHASIAPRLREADAWEMRVLFGVEPRYAVPHAIMVSEWGRCALVDGSPECIFGVRRVAERQGMPWLLGTDEIERRSITFVRRSREIMREIKGRYDVLSHYVAKRNVLSKRWLRSMGFRFFAPEWINGEEFLRFAWKADGYYTEFMREME